ncbi:hypothetical protein SLEP1_g55431 [Rubroshorea leprosula]|uniref:Uncharacterized protein n=1 Tax=Rubroshorea leprosula TaxID=152421 RepID=A0AAV5MID5_9ROSI|nr:hypothetical protein SLEP1_g55431 [Rubroshorea leprosula]
MACCADFSTHAGGEEKQTAAAAASSSSSPSAEFCEATPEKREKTKPGSVFGATTLCKISPQKTQLGRRRLSLLFAEIPYSTRAFDPFGPGMVSA